MLVVCLYRISIYFEDFLWLLGVDLEKREKEREWRGEESVCFLRVFDIEMGKWLLDLGLDL